MYVFVSVLLVLLCIIKQSEAGPYTLLSAKYNWFDGRTQCAAIGQTLAIFRSSDELLELIGMCQASGNSHCLVGYFDNDPSTNDDVIFVDGTDLTYVNWYGSEPGGDDDGDPLTVTDHGCGCLFPGFSTTHMFDCCCDCKLGVICGPSSIPAPAVTTANILFSIDGSRSIRSTYFDMILSDFSGYISSYFDGYINAVAIDVFDDSVLNVYGFIDTQTSTAIQSQISGISYPAGRTSIYDAVNSAIGLFDPTLYVFNYLVIFTDGDNKDTDICSDSALLANLFALLPNENIRVVGYGMTASDTSLSEISCLGTQEMSADFDAAGFFTAL